MKPLFKWCEDCKFFRSCYKFDDESGRIYGGPNCLEPACGEGPAK